MTHTPSQAMRTLLTLALFLVVAGCGGPPDPVAERAENAASRTGDVVIGAAWPWEAYGDLLYWQGMQLAADELNTEGGVGGRRLRLLRADDGESIDQGRMVAQELGRNPEVVAVIGHLQSYVTVPAAAIYDLSGLVMLSATSTSPELTSKGYPRVFRTIFDDVEVGRGMAEYAARREFRRVAIYYARNEYGRELANAFEEETVRRGGRVVDRQSYDPGVAANPLDAGNTAAAWKALDFDAVFVAGQDEQAALLVTELRRAGVGAPVLGSDAVATPGFLRRGGAAVEGTVIASPFHPADPSPEAQRFTAAFRKKYGREPDTGAALGYDAVRVLGHAMREAGSVSPDDVAKALHSVKGWKAVTGTFTFDRAGNLVDMPVRKVVVRGGAFHPLDETSGQ